MAKLIIDFEKINEMIDRKLDDIDKKMIGLSDSNKEDCLEFVSLKEKKYCLIDLLCEMSKLVKLEME